MGKNKKEKDPPKGLAAAARFLKIIPERLKKINSAKDSAVKPLSFYRPNELAAKIHPGRCHVVISKVVKLSRDVNLYTFIPDKEKGTSSFPPFQPGMYISVKIEKDGCEYSRPYSLASSPKEGREGIYEIAVKRCPGGIVSEYIHENWQEGTCIDISEPHGEFYYEPLRDAKTVIAIAGGSGITPFRSMMRSIKEGTDNYDLILLYGARCEEDLLFTKEPEFAEGSPNIKTVCVLSDEEKEGYEHGFITSDLIRKYAPEGEYSIFICGPQAMYRYLEGEIGKLGLRRKFIRSEVFGEIKEPEKEEDFIPSDKTEYNIKVIQNGIVTNITCRYNESLLSAMERSGIRAPSLCRSGECGFCHTRLISGKYYMPKRCDKRREADRIYGYIHPCCTFPLSDMEIDVPKAPY